MAENFVQLVLSRSYQFPTRTDWMHFCSSNFCPSVRVCWFTSEVNDEDNVNALITLWSVRRVEIPIEFRRDRVVGLRGACTHIILLQRDYNRKEAQ